MQIQSIQTQPQSCKKQITQKQPSFGMYLKLDEQLVTDFLDMTRSVLKKRCEDGIQQFESPLFYFTSLKKFIKKLQTDIGLHNANPQNHINHPQSINITDIDYRCKMNEFRHKENREQSILGIFKKDDLITDRFFTFKTDYSEAIPKFDSYAGDTTKDNAATKIQAQLINFDLEKQAHKDTLDEYREIINDSLYFHGVSKKFITELFSSTPYETDSPEKIDILKEILTQNKDSSLRKALENVVLNSHNSLNLHKNNNRKLLKELFGVCKTQPGNKNNSKLDLEKFMLNLVSSMNLANKDEQILLKEIVGNYESHPNFDKALEKTFNAVKNERN